MKNEVILRNNEVKIFVSFGKPNNQLFASGGARAKHLCVCNVKKGRKTNR